MVLNTIINPFLVFGFLCPVEGFEWAIFPQKIHQSQRFQGHQQHHSTTMLRTIFFFHFVFVIFICLFFLSLSFRFFFRKRFNAHWRIIRLHLNYVFFFINLIFPAKEKPCLNHPTQTVCRRKKKFKNVNCNFIRIVFESLSFSFCIVSISVSFGVSFSFAHHIILTFSCTITNEY